MANPHPVCRFPKGQSGNPGGRPKGKSITARLRAKLEQVDPATGITFAELVANALVDAAIDGDIAAIRVILERTEGKVPDRVRIAHRDESERALSIVLDGLAGFPEARLVIARQLKDAAADESDSTHPWIVADPEPIAGRIPLRAIPAACMS